MPRSSNGLGKMIVRRLNGDLQLVLQTDHDDLSGQFAARFGGGRPSGTPSRASRCCWPAPGTTTVGTVR